MTTDVRTAAITLTAKAADRLQSLIQERGKPDAGLRVFVSGGGCSGMQYGMAFESDVRETDQVFDSGGLKIIVDPTSIMYLAGSQIDFVDNLMGGGFAIENPNAVSSCGCGHSFRTAEAGAGGGGCATC